MKFGIREVTDITFKAKSSVYIGSRLFVPGQTVLAIDSAKTSTLEGAATTVYATGGRGNARLIAWEGEKTLTFTLEDALISPMGISILTGAGLINDITSDNKVHIHRTFLNVIEQDTKDKTKYFVNLTDALDKDEKICENAPLFALIAENDGSLTGEMLEAGEIVSAKDNSKKVYVTGKNGQDLSKMIGKTIVIDCYVIKNEASVYEVQIDASSFAGYYYVEGETYFRKQETGKDMPAYLTIPNVKIQSNFTFTMASSGDPSTFTFTMDAFPGYTYFNRTKKVLCVIQIVDETKAPKSDSQSVMLHKGSEGQIAPEKDEGDQDSKQNRTTPIFGTDIIFVDGEHPETELTETDCKWNAKTNTLTFESTSAKTVQVKVKDAVTFDGDLTEDGTTQAITPSTTKKFCGTTYTTKDKSNVIDYAWHVVKKSGS